MKPTGDWSIDHPGQDDESIEQLIKGQQQMRIYEAIVRNPGLTAFGCAEEIGHPSHYAPATVLRELHRLAQRGLLVKRQERGMRGGTAWRWYPVSMRTEAKP